MPRVYLDLRAHRDSHAAGETPWTPAIAVVYQVDEGIRLMAAEGADQHLRPPRGVCRGVAGRPPGARLRAVRRPAPRLEDGHRRGRPGRPRLEVVQRRAQAPRPGPGRRPGQADRQDLPARPSRVGHARGDPRRDERPRDRRRSAPAAPVRPGSAVAAAQVAALESYGDRRTGGRRGRCVRVLVAEPVAERGHRAPAGPPPGRRAAGPVARRAVRDPARLRRADRPQPGPGRCRAHRRRDAAGGHRPRRGRRRQRRPRGGDARRHRRRQRPDREHDRRGRAHPGAALRRRPPDRRGRCVAPARRVEARPVHRARAARPDARHRRARQDRAGHRGPGAGDGDDRPRGRPVRDRRGGRQPRGRAGRVRRDAGPRRRRDRPRAADARRRAG